VLGRYYLDLSYATLAETLGVSTGTATATVTQALARMREAIATTVAEGSRVVNNTDSYEDEVRAYLRARLDPIPVGGTARHARPRSRWAPFVFAPLWVVLAVVLGLGVGGLLNQRALVASSPAPALSPTGRLTVSASGFAFVLPAGWHTQDRDDIVNRRSRRILVIWNRPGTVPAAAVVNGEPDLLSLPADIVLVELRDGTGATIEVPTADTAFPLSTASATRSQSAAGFEMWQLTFDRGARRYLLVVHIGSAASPLDRASVGPLVESLRPAP
jgi:hypothetical protein